jgi:hypothetical protein
LYRGRRLFAQKSSSARLTSRFKAFLHHEQAGIVHGGMCQVFVLIAQQYHALQIKKSIFIVKKQLNDFYQNYSNLSKE